MAKTKTTKTTAKTKATAKTTKTKATADKVDCPACGAKVWLTKRGVLPKHGPPWGRDYVLPLDAKGNCGAVGLALAEAKEKSAGRPPEEDRQWAAAAATSEVAEILALPATIADCGRATLEVTAVLLGLQEPEEESDADLEAAVDQAIDDQHEAALAVWRYFHPDEKKPGDPGKEWARIHEHPDWWRGNGSGLWWQDGELTEVNPYHWRPILDPSAPLFEPRVELPPHPVTQESIAAQGVIVPLVVTVDEQDLVILDGLQRMRAVRAVNRARLAEWARKGKPSAPLITLVPVRAVIGSGAYPALGAANEVRQPADPMTRAMRIEQLYRKGGLSVREAAAALGLKERMGTYLLSLNKLTPQIQRKVRKGTVSFKLARVLCQLAEHELQHRALEAVRDISVAQAVAGLRAVLADDEMCAALRAGADFALPEGAEIGRFTTCPLTGAWFRVAKGGATVLRGGRRLYIAPGALESETAKPRDRLRRALDTKAGGTDRDRRLVAAALAALEGAEVPGEFAWLLGERPTAGRKAAPDPRQTDVEEYVKKPGARVPPPRATP